MPFDASAGQRAAMGCGDNTNTTRRTGVTTLSQLACENDQPERERVFRAMFDRAAIGIAHVSLDGRWLRFNQRLCDILGYDAEGLAARTWLEITHPDDRDVSEAYSQRLLAGELDTYELDKRYIRKDGTLIWVHLTVMLVRTPEGKPDDFITMVQDITERKCLEQACAQLLEQERAAHAEAEATNAQLRALQALTDTALSYLALDDLLRELLSRLVAVMGVDHIAIFLLDEDGQTLTLRAGHGLAEEHVGWVQVQVGPGFTGRIAASRAPLIVDDLTAFDVEGVHPTLRETARSAAGVPLLVVDHAADRMEGAVAEGRLVGVLVVGSATPRRFTETDMLLLQRAADRVALAVDRARLYAAEHDARRRAEAALARATESEAQARGALSRLSTILETMADGVVVYDTCGRIVQSNRAFRELLATDRVPGFDALPLAERAPFFDLRDAATGEPVPLARIPTTRALRGEVVTKPEAEHLIHAMDGHEISVSISAAPLRDGYGRIVGSVSVLRDQTQRKRLEHEREEARAHELALRELDQRKDEFLNLLGHEIRTPLTSVQGYIQLLIRHFNNVRTRELGDLGEPEDQRADHLTHDIAMARTMLAYSEASIQRLTRLANDLIDHVRIRDGRLTVRRTACDLSAIVRASVEEQRVLEDHRVLHLDLPDAQAVPVIADADRIAQVVTNYLTNALKYSKADRPITVRLEVDGDMARVCVRDEGPGIARSDQMHVFERFPRIKGTAVQSGSGVSLGLGLSICKAIIEAHGGLVGVESMIGKGSTFWFTLPLSAPMPDHDDPAGIRLPSHDRGANFDIGGDSAMPFGMSEFFVSGDGEFLGL